VSVWRRRAGALAYDMLGLHRLVPPPARGAGAAAPTLLACAVGAWVRGGSVAQQATVVAPAGAAVGAGAGAPGAAAARNLAPGAATMQVAGSGWGSGSARDACAACRGPVPGWGSHAVVQRACARCRPSWAGGASAGRLAFAVMHSSVARHSHRSGAWPWASQQARAAGGVHPGFAAAADDHPERGRERVQQQRGHDARVHGPLRLH